MSEAGNRPAEPSKEAKEWAKGRMAVFHKLAWDLSRPDAPEGPEMYSPAVLELEARDSYDAGHAAALATVRAEIERIHPFFKEREWDLVNDFRAWIDAQQNG